MTSFNCQQFACEVSFSLVAPNSVSQTNLWTFEPICYSVGFMFWWTFELNLYLVEIKLVPIWQMHRPHSMAQFTGEVARGLQRIFYSLDHEHIDRGPHWTYNQICKACLTWGNPRTAQISLARYFYTQHNCLMCPCVCDRNRYTADIETKCKHSPGQLDRYTGW